MKADTIKFMGSEEAVSETIGYTFILTIVLISVVILVVSAYSIQSTLQETAFIESQIQALTMLEGRINSVALGASPSLLTRINLNGGTMNVRNDSDNYVNITVFNETGTPVYSVNRTLGLIEFKLGENRLIFENGGLFRIYPTGESEMLSTPEFYFNGETLTFPLIRIQSSASVGGKGSILVVANSGGNNEKIYPNVSNSLLNPITGKQVMIRIKSDNYKALARYIEERTDAIPNSIDSTKEVVVQFNMQPSENPKPLVVPIEVYNMNISESAPITQFRFNLTGVNSSLRMVLNTSNGFFLDIKKKDTTVNIYLDVRYNKDGANESWNSSILSVNRSGNASIDLLNSSVNMIYNNSVNSTTWANETSYNGTYTKFAGSNGPVPLDILMQHYIKLINPKGTFVLYNSTVASEWNGFNKAAPVTLSNYTLTYLLMPPNINFLHIIDHPVNVAIS